ncbi:MAG: GNAT family N-acetyltransferase [Acidobacteriota bacterium]
MDLKLAERLEDSDSLMNVAYAKAVERLQPQLSPAYAFFSGGSVVYAGKNNPLSRAVGFGLRGQVAEEDLEFIEDFYRSRDSMTQIDLCPLAHSSLMHLLGERNYQFGEFINTWILELARLQLPDSLPGVEVREARESEGRIWMETVKYGFSTVEESAAIPIEFFEPFLQMPNTHCFIAWIDGQAAGAGTVAINDGIASLFGTSTLTRFRNRGAQSALLRARLRLALELNCELAMVGTTPGSGSQRNVERAGFRLAYTKAQMVKGWDSIAFGGV